MGNKPSFVLLAGGKSERMGVPKGLLKFYKTFWILEQLRRISKNNISEVYIGLGYDYQLYFGAIDWFEKAVQTPYNFSGLAVHILINLTPELGSFSTLQSVLKQIPKNSDILINPIDVPLCNTKELQKIISTNNLAVIPQYKFKNGHPIKLENRFWNRMTQLDPLEKTARLDFQIKRLNPKDISYVTVDDASILKNLNTPSEWKTFLKKDKN